MTRNEDLAAQIRREFAEARAAFLTEATPFELKLDAFLAKAERFIAKALTPVLGAEPTPAAEDALSS